jgi:uncharacterized protein YecA (UPF0149 family)
MITLDTLLNMTDQELREWFRQNVINAEPDPEFYGYCIEYHRNVENDFEAEWSCKKFKWFLKKRRQKKLMEEISLRYTAPVFYLIERTIDEILPDMTTNNYFDQFVDFKGA